MAVLKNQKHERFALLIAKGESAGAAYQKVYHSKKATCETNGPQLLRNAQVKARVRELQEKAEDETVMSLLERRRFLARVVRTPIGLIDEQSDLCHEFTSHWEGGRRGKLKQGHLPEGNETGEEEVEVVKIKAHDKLKAIELDSKLAGDFKEKVLHEMGDSLTDFLLGIRKK